MKFKYWRLVLCCAIGICWGWFCHQAISASIKNPNLPISLVSAVVGKNLHQQIEIDSQHVNYRLSNGDATRTNDEWIGRLILPNLEEVKKFDRIDWVWVKIKHAPAINRELIGKTIRLIWQPKSTIEADVRQVTTDINFTPGTIASQKEGNIHPQRLNGRSRVGALQSLAGAREIDNILVRLAGVNIDRENSSKHPILTIDREPVQITGTLTGLVKVLGTDPNLPTDCNQVQSCPKEYFRVRHYNPNSRGFDGQTETILIPQVPAKKSGLLPSTIRDLDRSPAGHQGWYINGERDASGLFTVAAIQPRSLFTLTPQRNLTGADAKLDYLNDRHWANILQQKGTLSQVTFDRRTERLGDRSLVIHLFGGIGGKTGDSQGLWQTVTGHFAYGMATVIRSEFTGELEWEIEYNQVYAHNSDGIIAGKQDWATYMGHLQRGWLATRPVADLLINYPPVTEDYDFGGIQLSPLTELQRQLHIAGARYRSGDGTGNASVTPATSCVQDANQALYVTIRQLNRQVQSQPQIPAWIATHPQHPQTLRFRELQSLGAELETTLAPLGIVRQDWQENATKLAGTGLDKGFMSSSNPVAGLISWRTMLPRGAQDGIAKIFSRHGATIWFLNTVQVGGVNPDIIPIAPTILFGQFPLLSTLVIRIWAGIVTLPNLSDWFFVLVLIVCYAAIALPIGFGFSFLTLDYAPKSQLNIADLGLVKFAQSWVSIFFMPALIEEIGFRLLLIPHPIETATSKDIYIWSAISLGLFIIYHPINALTLFRSGNPTFMDWRFLTLAGWLGGVCTIAYLMTGSIWSSVVIHWLVVGLWLNIFGGKQRLIKS